EVPVPAAEIVGQETHERMPDQRNRYADRNPPDDERPAPDQITQQGPRNLLQHPRPLHEAVDTIAGHVWLDNEFRWMRETQFTMQLPQQVAPHRARVDKEGMAGRVALRPVANVVRIQHPKRPSHAHDRSQVHEYMFQPAAALEAAVNEQAVQAN